MAEANRARDLQTPSDTGEMPIRPRGGDAVDMLKADHRRILRMLQRFHNGQDAATRAKLVDDICQALTLHMMLEEEIFYPAFLQATQDSELHNEARVEHDAVRRLIAQIEESGPEDPSFIARVKVLTAMIRHHVVEEEKRDGMFAEAASAGMDLLALGERMKTRKLRLRKKLQLLRGGCQVAALALGTTGEHPILENTGEHPTLEK